MMRPGLMTDLPAEAALAELAEAGRIRLAANSEASSSALRQLAADPAVAVRATVAMNQATGDSLFNTIASDPDDRVRALLAQRLAMLLPTLPDDHRDQLREHILATLMTLVTDQAIRVRAAIADVVKDMPGVPHALILKLARDSVISVAEPVIRLSPLLTNQDLLALIAAPPGPSTVTAVARRPGLAAQVAAAIADAGDATAITALLTNHTASISEATLDSLISRAAQHIDWHIPLVRRPRLSARAARALSGIVTGHVLAELAERADMPTEVAREIARRLGMAMAAHGGGRARANLDPPSLDDAVLLARDMAKAGQLTEEAIIAAARRGEARMCTAMLAATAGVAPAVVDHAAKLRSAKGLVSLIWRAGFTMRAAGPLQTLLVRMPPEAVLHPGEHGEFPFTPEEMRWQVEFLTRIGRDPPQFP